MYKHVYNVSNHFSHMEHPARLEQGPSAKNAVLDPGLTANSANIYRWQNYSNGKNLYFKK